MTAANRPAPPTPSFITRAERDSHPQPSAINVERVDRNINESLRKQIVEIITRNPDLALSIVRGWKDKKR